MKVNDSNTALHLLKPEYPISYEIPQIKQIISKLSKVLKFLEKATPSNLINKKTKKIISKNNLVDENTMIPESTFRLTSYEWGVTYYGLLRLGEISGLEKFSNYTFKRLEMISSLFHFYKKNKNVKLEENSPIYSVLYPAALDDSGALCFSMIKAKQINSSLNLEPLINNFINYISNSQFRFKDKTLARNRPYKNTLWIDDLFMSVPALAIMGKISGNKKYFDDAVNQVLKFSQRMFDGEKGLYAHGWVEKVQPKPKFFWARANGWALMAMVELLSLLPKKNIGYKKVLNQFLEHLKGLVSYQSSSGFWHQLIDKNDSYLETSATAIFTYSIAKAINEGIIDKFVFAPIAILGWNAISTKINTNGQIDGICVGTGMGFDNAFYYNRPTNKFAAHGYGPMFLAGAEILRLINSNRFNFVEGSIQLTEANIK